uniref:Mitochondrial calcium uptake 2 n=1 Tax=Stegastes partitus TaxID=144197 RepID=A0A3B4Z575_9TELE
MASWGKVAAVLRTVLRSPRSLKSVAVRRSVGPGVVGSVIGTGLLCYYQYHASSRTLPFAVHAEEQKTEQMYEAPAPQLSARRIRFNQFASVVYEQEPYMTPRDFLFSVMLENVDRKAPYKLLEVNKMLAAASKARGGNDLFRTLGDNGLLSYTEYLFLLTILTKPRTGFHIAFKMLDVDGNEHVDKKEFLKVRPDWDAANTTLQAYFFGKRGEKKLQYQEFRRFMEDLQAEVQEMEFLQFSRGMDTMRREDFAEWLLHYTNEEDNEVYWENMRKKIPAGQSITFDEFKVFCLFTNNLEDFAFSMKMVTEANRPVGMAQFKRAVRIATGHDLSENVLDTVFKLFDMDGDNCLSHKEFIGVMKDRVLRGLKVQPQNGISGYWKCVKRETLKAAQEALGDTGCPI